MGVFDKNSIVFISAVRFGIVTMIAAIIAYQFEFTRPFYMSDFTIVATYHRAIQRAFGTILGILIASLILMTPFPNCFMFVKRWRMPLIENYHPQ
jgi:uncharacterized membrane protein YccC